MARTGTMPDDGDMTNTTDTRSTKPTLERSRDDRVIAGVAGGLGTYLGTNPWLFRFAFIVLTFFGGLGILLYLAAWLVIPDQGADTPIVGRWVGNLDTADAGTIFGIVLVVAAVLIVLGQIANVSGTLIVALVLFVIGFLLYRGDLAPKRTGDDPPSGDTMNTETPDNESSHDEPLAPAPAATIVESPPSTDGVDGDPPTFEPPPPEPEIMWEPPPRPEPSFLGRITVAVGLIVLASMALIDLAFTAVSIEPVHYVATAVGIAGLGLLVGSWVGRARWLIIIGVVLLPVLWFTSFWPDDFSFSAGETRYAPISASDVSSPYELGMGQMTVDLTALSTEELADIGTIEASLGMGELIVVIPEGTGAVIDAQVGMGAVEGPFDEAAGVGVEATRIVGPEPTSLVLRLEVGAGVITIQRSFIEFEPIPPPGGFQGSTP